MDHRQIWVEDDADVGGIEEWGIARASERKKIERERERKNL